MSGFNANVPARKPRTAIGRVLTELTSEPQEPVVDASALSLPLEGNAPVETSSASVAESAPPTHASQAATVLRSVARAVPEPAPPRSAVEQLAPRPAQDGVRAGPAEPNRIAVGRERIATLRERLSASTRPKVAATEPKRAAAHVLEVVEEMRARLDSAIQERSAMAWALDEARHVLARMEADLEKERKVRASVEAQAEERARIADEAVSEAEALAAERDQVLAELAEQRRLDDEQASLLLEAEQVLTMRDVASEVAARELADVRAIVEAQSVEIQELKGRLEMEAVERGRVETRCRELEAEVARLGEAREALETLEASVRLRP
jgi:hypothetical protein